MNHSEYIALSLAKGIGDVAISKLHGYCEKNNLDSLYDIDLANLLSLPEFNRYREPFDAFFNQQVDILLERASNLIGEYSELEVSVLTLSDDNYPAQLKLMKTAPSILYYRGNASLLETNSVAIVGTRNATSIGLRVANKTAQFAVENSFTVVSGLALGIDTEAHRGALESGGGTISVLVDVGKVYPAKNKKLALDIVDSGGLLLAENPPMTPITGGLLAKRDRIQAGLSSAVFPIETTVDGGTMHAVRTALSEGRLLYVPDYSSGYYPSLDIEQLAGIRKLLESNQATPYTRESYSEISREIDKKYSEIMSSLKTTGQLF